MDAVEEDSQRRSQIHNPEWRVICSWMTIPKEGDLRNMSPSRGNIDKIKTSAPVIATEPAKSQTQASIKATEANDHGPQEKRRESADKKIIQHGPKVEEPKKDNEDVSAEQKVEEVNEGGRENDLEEDAAEEEDEPEIPDGAAPTETKTLAPLANNPVPPAKLGSTPRRAPKFKQRGTRNFKSKPPRKGVLGFGDEIPGMDGLGTDITVICPWEAFSHLELHELAQFGII
ncbi:uncharacterized protein LOC143785073 [Ranitomeya variabilis]|uniref:uncharacterized protein LOC143785073 n=1 Tax=Ranitomeya variabilis TaxID=490064 RepID=UPI004056E01C